MERSLHIFGCWPGDDLLIPREDGNFDIIAVRITSKPKHIKIGKLTTGVSGSLVNAEYWPSYELTKYEQQIISKKVLAKFGLTAFKQTL